MPEQTPSVRNRIRLRRRQLTPASARTCARQLAERLGRHPLLRYRQHIALYLPNDGEIGTQPLIELLCSQGKIIYLPVLLPFLHGKLWFARYRPGDVMVKNRYGIPEPFRLDLVAPRNLDLVLTPLVAFDHAGNRIGMGGGFYDRSFQFLLNRKHWRKPLLIGLAYEFQRERTLAPGRWDVPLDGIATERQVRILSR